MKTILLVLALALTVTFSSNAATIHSVAKNPTENTVKAPAKSNNASKAKSGTTKKHHAKKHAATSVAKKTKQLPDNKKSFKTDFEFNSKLLAKQI